jgi:hypothetical protein
MTGSRKTAAAIKRARGARQSAARKSTPRKSTARKSATPKSAALKARGPRERDASSVSPASTTVPSRVPPRRSPPATRREPAESGGMMGGSPSDEGDDMTMPLDNDELLEETDVDLGGDDGGDDDLER